ncbi:hypothetical protein DF057_02410 [Burkholderia cepacia]|uniref:hypothetical protein n=1 Tax=Burkholderia cepacia TaxID=292 RepID=UPI000F600D72|nr:hypothetical protein [Burkholderia cepacia]RQZ64605.1 hypothetical protein DF057_02410 [Burkholderia cepacia]
MFEITPEHIAQLNDVDLRELVGRLCEAELSCRGLSPVAVTWGGNQTAPDGGLDVRVALDDGKQVDGFIPQSHTGFQVKKPDMQPAEILSEMRPKGTIRPVIAELAEQKGAYVIVSSTGSVADEALSRRRHAMSEAVRDVAHGDQLTTDFYDRRRMASWVACHPGLVVWVRERVGRSLTGWRPYGSWSSAESVEAEYLMDGTVRADLGTTEGADCSVIDALQSLRKELAQPQAVVRLVGLSGVGKTRFVQALFDERVGTSALPKSLAIYTNSSNEPDPSPTALLTNLIANRKQAVLIIDNCAFELHERLTDICRQEDGRVSLLTVEYDVRDDQPEGTHVVRLDSASTDLVTALLDRRFPHLSGVNAATIARASGGNARMAIALAETVARTDSIEGLSNEALFDRLFRQRQDPNSALLRAAQACSLVYSFEGESLKGETAELPRLAGLAGQPVEETYRHVVELLRRELVQKRGVWRAVLPHALANRLASQALEDIPYDTIDEHLMSTERLARSFSRRLSFLHAHPKAVAIVRNWLAPEGLLGDVVNLNDLGRTMFENVAPVDPDVTLAALERISTSDALTKLRYWSRQVSLLRALAYDAKLFSRGATLLAQLATASDSTSLSRAASEAFLSLFTICLSGTRATIGQRLDVVATLLRSGSEAERRLGVEALSRSLQTEHFNSFGRFDFGSRSRDYGLQPSTIEEIAEWFRSTLTFLDQMATTIPDVRLALYAIFAERFRGLWMRGYVQDEIDKLLRSISSHAFWAEGWVACRQTLRFCAAGLDAASLSRLTNLELTLRPKTLSDKVRAFVLCRNTVGLDTHIETDEQSGSSMERVMEVASQLGADVANDLATFAEIVPEAMTTGKWSFAFGRGLAAGASNRRQMWSRLLDVLEGIAPQHRRIDVLEGYLAWLWNSDRLLADELFDAALENPVLRPFFPYLQSAIKIDVRAANRLKQALDDGIAAIGSYAGLSMGRATEALPAVSLRDLVLAIAAQPGGFDTALRIFSMHIWGGDRTAAIDPVLIDTGRTLLGQAEFGADEVNADVQFAHVAKMTLATADARSIVTEFTRRFGAAIEQRQISWSDYPDLLSELFASHPEPVLDALLRDPGSENELGELADRGRANPASAISPEQLITWCSNDADNRYPQVARIVPYARSKENAAGLEWTQHAVALLKHAPDPIAVLAAFIKRMRPSAWSGSLAEIMEVNAQLLDRLDVVLSDTAMQSVREAQKQLAKQIAAERERETHDDRGRDETFE